MASVTVTKTGESIELRVEADTDARCSYLLGKAVEVRNPLESVAAKVKLR